MLCDTFIGPSSSCFDPIERVQTKFLRAILEVPRCVTNAHIRLESGSLTMVNKITLASLQYWLKINFKLQGLNHLLLEDNFQSKWMKAVLNKLQVMGFFPQAILSMQWDEAKLALKQRIMDMERQVDLR